MRLVLPLIPFTVAEIADVPEPVLVAKPEAATTATGGREELQFAPHNVCVLPSLKFPLAVNCCEFPTAILGFAGESVIDVRVALVTVTCIVLVTVPIVAVMVAVPGVRPETIPVW